MGFLIEAIATFLLETIFGHTGAFFLRVVSFGKIQMDPETGGESVLAQVIGFFVFVGVAVLVAWIIRTSTVTPTTGTIILE